MELKSYTNGELYSLKREKQLEKDERMIRRIVQQVHSFVVYNAKEGNRSFSWNQDSYPFDNFTEYELKHVVEACSRIAKLFPEATITRPRTKEILVEWV